MVFSVKLRDPGRIRVGVIGAGVVGLSTALRVLQEFPNSVHLEVLADKFETDTTSDGAAGIMRPVMTPYHLQDPAYLRKWSQTSWSRYNSLFFSPEADEVGVTQVGGYHFFSHPNAPDQPFYQDIVYHCHKLEQSELDSFPLGKKWKSGYYFNSILVECRKYLPWLKKTIKAMGADIKLEKVDNMQSLSGRFDMVFNCCGIGARELVGDKDVVPIRGVLIRANAPQIKHCYYFDDDSYIVPCFDSLVIGGIREKGNFNLEVSQSDKDELWARARGYLPTLANAETLWEWAGLRPHRDPIRVEGELMRFKTISTTSSKHLPISLLTLTSNLQDTFHDTLPVIHNYGHGGHGVTLSWGTAVEAVEILKKCLETKLE